MSQIIFGSDFTGTLDITNLTGATEHALLVGAADGSLVSLAVAGDGVLPIGSAGNDPVLANLTAGANINILDGPGSITISAVGGGIGPTFQDDVFRVYDDGDNSKLFALQCDQITTGNTRTLTMCDQDLSLIAPDFPGSVSTGGNFSMPVTNATFTEGVWRVGGLLFMHNLGTRNTFFGINSGSVLTTGRDNTCLGFNSLTDTTTGNFNSMVGSYAGENITTGSLNVGIGAPVLSTLTTGDLNIAIGSGSGISYTGAESSNICISNDGVLGEDNTIHIGTQGSGAGEQDSCFIAGIVGTNVGNVATVVSHDANGQLGTTTITAGANTTVTAGANNITIATSGHELWNEIAGTTQDAEVNNGYITTNAAQTDIVLPLVSAVGSVIKILGNGTGGWKLSQNAAQYVRINEVEITTVGLAGFITSTDNYDSLEIVCTAANTGWTVYGNKGNLYYE